MESYPTMLTAICGGSLILLSLGAIIIFIFGVIVFLKYDNQEFTGRKGIVYITAEGGGLLNRGQKYSGKFLVGEAGKKYGNEIEVVFLKKLSGGLDILDVMSQRFVKESQIRWLED